MRYYKLLYNFENDKGAICVKHKELYGVSKYDLEEGHYCNNWDERITLYYDPNKGERTTDFLASTFGGLVISSKFKAILENLKVGGIQYIPINIQADTDGKKLEGYYIANILNLVDALDLEHSEYKEFSAAGGKVKMLSVMVFALKRNQIENIHVLRLKNQNMPMFISEKVKLAIESNNLTGFSFHEVEVV
ncbi:MAG: imm11 family protein [Ruminiclostridium sp.]